MEAKIEKTVPIFLARFSEHKYITSFVKKGELYMNPISSFQTIEDGNVRGDSHENRTSLLQPQNIQLEINGHAFDPKNFAAPISIYSPDDDKERITHIFSMLSINNQSHVRDDMRIFDPRINEFGDTAALIPNKNIGIYFQRVRQKLQQLCDRGEIHSSKSSLVNYIPFGTYHGSTDAFTKPDAYKWQCEFRIGVSAYQDSSPIVLELGSLEDICYTIKISDMKNRVEIAADGKTYLHL